VLERDNKPGCVCYGQCNDRMVLIDSTCMAKQRYDALVLLQVDSDASGGI
jgi:hypothetical protein